ncbi:MAG: preprotein translocase subunit SecA [Desulfobacteraceae bacterium]|nr:MAG: preprotein translocase subunit SecA [Desulfobacteraceae bacterium]
MIWELLTNIFGSKNEREIKRIIPIVDAINQLETKMQAMSDDQLRSQTGVLKEKLAQGADLDELLPEAFATVREASVRSVQMRHFDVQMIGGVFLHKGRIAEMKTGEGKTLVATLPAYLNALVGKGVHIVTVNDYLARRDTEWMGKIYAFLGLSVGTVLHGLTDAERRSAYNSDITYGTNNEFGFDYLRDNMKFDLDTIVQRDLHYAIVDEVDSILIDEARTPLIISGPAEKSTNLYYQVNGIIPRLEMDRHFSKDEKARSVALTEEGVAAAEKLLQIENLYDPRNIEILHHVNQALKAHNLFQRDVDYIVKDGQVIIVDEFTGRLMPGRRYSDGLHQALEAKESVNIENENQTLATITFQNYFRMYAKLAGMTGTADTEAAEFKKIYNLDVNVIPTHMPMIRKDHPDVIYKTKREKYEAALDEIESLHKKGQPVLVGTISIDVSEQIANKLQKRGIKHSVLNAKNHEAEAEIIAMAGQKGSVTISTNMAGRGTDIRLGQGVTDLGGLHILGTERHESRRIDNQLRGRSGRQGDPGSSRFYLSLEDDLLRIFGGERIGNIMERLGLQDGEPIEHNLISRAIENAQTKVEAHNFDIRKHLIEYDDVMNQQREVIYRQRRELLTSRDIHETISDMIMEKAEQVGSQFADEKALPEDWDFERLSDAVFQQFNYRLKSFDAATLDGLTRDGLIEEIYDQVLAYHQQRERQFGSDAMRHLERVIMLQTVDNLWKDHLLSMDHLKEGIGLRGYAQQNPLLVYKKEGFDLFQDLIDRIKSETLNLLFRVQLAEPASLKEMQREQEKDLVFSGAGNGAAPPKKKPVRRSDNKVGRNAPCPCGSGKKYKKCCGR